MCGYGIYSLRKSEAGIVSAGVTARIESSANGLTMFFSLSCVATAVIIVAVIFYTRQVLKPPPFSLIP